LTCWNLNFKSDELSEIKEWPSKNGVKKTGSIKKRRNACETV
jgi:hypothetical protein